MRGDARAATDAPPLPPTLAAMGARFADLYPFGRRWFEHGGVRMHYVDEGRGDPVVMLHGNPTWSFYFRNLARGLRETHRTIVPDHIGCGLSDKPGDDRYPYSLARRIEDVEALLVHLAIDRPVTLVLHDWGGMIGMGFATRHPDRIARLVVLNTAAFRMPAAKKLPWQLWVTRNTPMGALLVRGLNAFARGAASRCVTRAPMPPDVRAAYLAPYDSWANRIAVLRFVQDIPLAAGDRGYDLVSDVERGLGRFAATPMLIAWGMRDFVFDADFLAEWTRRFPEARVRRFDDAGHYVLEDAPDEILALVREFLDAR